MLVLCLSVPYLCTMLDDTKNHAALTQHFMSHKDTYHTETMTRSF